jgi:hypothetical protein
MPTIKRIHDSALRRRHSAYPGTAQTRTDPATRRQQWLKLRKGPFPGSTGKSWHVPNDADVEWGITAYKAVRGIYLFPNVLVRTTSRDAVVRGQVYMGIMPCPWGLLLRESYSDRIPRSAPNPTIPAAAEWSTSESLGLAWTDHRCICNYAKSLSTPL